MTEFYLEALWQRCAVHFYRDVWTAVPTSEVRDLAAMQKTIHAQEGRGSPSKGRPRHEEAGNEAGAAVCVAKAVEETLQHFYFPSEHWRSLRTNNSLERVMR